MTSTITILMKITTIIINDYHNDTNFLTLRVRLKFTH